MKKRSAGERQWRPQPVLTLAMACFTPARDSKTHLCTQQTNDSTLERIKNKVELETRETLDYKHTKRVPGRHHTVPAESSSR